MGRENFERREGERRMSAADNEQQPEQQQDLSKLESLAAALYRSEKFNESIDVLRKCLMIREKLLGTNHVDTLTTANNLASSLGRIRKFEEAEELLRKTLSGRETLLGLEHVDTLTTVNHIGVVLKQRGKLIESEPYFGRALDGFTKLFGVNNYFTGEAAYNYGVLSVQLGRKRRAGELFAIAHKALSESLGSEHQHALDALFWEVKCVSDSSVVNNATDGQQNANIQWKQSSSCEVCHLSYNLLRRQHHCRTCLRSVCHECSLGKTIVLPFDAVNPVRYCNICEQQGF